MLKRPLVYNIFYHRRSSYLFAGIRRQIEHQNRHERQPDARDDQVHGVEQRFTSHFYVKRYVCEKRPRIHKHEHYVMELTDEIILRQTVGATIM